MVEVHFHQQGHQSPAIHVHRRPLHEPGTLPRNQPAAFATTLVPCLPCRKPARQHYLARRFEPRRRDSCSNRPAEDGAAGQRHARSGQRIGQTRKCLLQRLGGCRCGGLDSHPDTGCSQDHFRIDVTQPRQFQAQCRVPFSSAVGSRPLPSPSVGTSICHCIACPGQTWPCQMSCWLTRDSSC